MTGVRHFTASAIVFDDQERILLVHHNKIGRRLYPGGHIDPNEDPAQAAQREVLEETGIHTEVFSDDPFTSSGRHHTCAAIHHHHRDGRDRYQGRATSPHRPRLLPASRLRGADRPTRRGPRSPVGPARRPVRTGHAGRTAHARRRCDPVGQKPPAAHTGGHLLSRLSESNRRPVHYESGFRRRPWAQPVTTVADSPTSGRRSHRS